MTQPTNEQIMRYHVPDLHRLMANINDNAQKHGFWEEDNHAEKIALMHSELSEALEADRKDPPPMSDHIPDFLLIEEELADEIIRVLDYAQQHNLNIVCAITAKCAYNEGRPYKHGKKY